MAEYIDKAKVLEKAVEIKGCFSKMISAWDVAHIPSADVAEVKHGKWEGITTSAYIGTDKYGEPKFADRQFYVHRKCGRRSAIKEKYCPNCGAKMDGE